MGVEGGQTNPCTKARGYRKPQLPYLISSSHIHIPITSMENSQLFSYCVRSKCVLYMITSQNFINCQMHQLHDASGELSCPTRDQLRCSGGS